MQENRTPDNLFGSQAAGPCSTAGTFPGADLVNGGTGIVKGQSGQICNVSYPMNSGYDPNHQNEDWKTDYDTGGMDGFCDGATWPSCPGYSYVQQSDVGPYVAIAKTYGFANYMFQTNEAQALKRISFCLPVPPLP